MSDQKYFYKGRDLIQLRKFLLNILITIIFSLVGILSFFVSTSSALSWKDEEWLNSGCPKSVAGKWISDNPSTAKIKSLSINKDEVTFLSQDDQAQHFRISKSSFVSENQYVEIKLNQNNNEKVIKIRPHLVHMESQKQEKSSTCLIKVFDFKNQSHARTDKYSGWGIFRLIK